MKKIYLRCSSCHEAVLLHEQVTLDIANTITHETCTPTGLPISDYGTYRLLLERHPFLKKTV